MGFEISKLATDRTAEVVGTWTEDLGAGLKLLVAREGNARFTDEMRKAVKMRAGAGGLGELTAEAAAEIAVDVYARTILLGWEGLEENGKPVTYSVEEAKRLLEQYPDFFKLVQTQARRVDLFRAQKRKEAEGNS